MSLLQGQKRSATSGGSKVVQWKSSTSSNIPSTTQTWKCTWPFRLEPKRWMKANCANVQRRLVQLRHPRSVGLQALRNDPQKMRSTMLSTGPSRFMKWHKRFGTNSTHWRTGRLENT